LWQTCITWLLSAIDFQGYQTFPGHFVKIFAYADDTAVHLGTLTDVKIYKLLLRQYALATGGVTNFGKSEGVLCGKWKVNLPNLGIRVVKASKYLGVITGNDPDMVLVAIALRENKVYRQLDTWDHKLSSSPIDRVMVAKIMCPSLLWYHAGIAPEWEPALRRIEKRVQDFIWKKGIPKVAKATLHLPNNKGGLVVWSLVKKAKAFTTMWVVKAIQNLMNPILEANVQAATRHYAEVRNTQVPLWESCLDHSHDIVATTGFKLLAMMQG
jgi:hypothetical protein